MGNCDIGRFEQERVVIDVLSTGDEILIRDRQVVDLIFEVFV